MNENGKRSDLRAYLITFGTVAAIISCSLVYIYFGLTASLILAQFIAVPLAIGFILDSRVRAKRATTGKPS